MTTQGANLMTTPPTYPQCLDVYIGSPYSHIDKIERDWRANVSYQYSRILITKNLSFFSPLAHTHKIQSLATISKPLDYWMSIALPILRICRHLHVLTLPGWIDSPGLLLEIRFALFHRIPTSYINPYTFTSTPQPPDAA